MMWQHHTYILHLACLPIWLLFMVGIALQRASQGFTT
jgi:hypothetical protein